MSALSLFATRRGRASLTSRLAGSWAGYWLVGCLLAWLTAHALANTARLIWPEAGTRFPATQVALDPGTLPPVPSAWGTAPSLDDRPIPITDLPYTVVGQAIADTPNASLVVLTTPSGQQTRMAGDAVEPAITIERIDAEGVIFSRQGRLERLPLPSKRVADSPITRTSLAPGSIESPPAAQHSTP